MKEEMPLKDDEMADDDFDSGLEDDFDILCNVVSILPTDYDFVNEVAEPEDCDEEEMERHKHVCYFVMNNGCIEE